MASSTKNSVPTNKYDTYLDQRIAQTSQQVKWVELLSYSLGAAIYLLASLFVLCLIDAWVFELQVWMRWTALILLGAGCLAVIVFRALPYFLHKVNPLYAAKMLENGRPELKNSVINYLTTESQSGRKSFEGIRQKMSQKAATDVANIPIDTTVDRSKMIFAGYTLAAVVAVFALYIIFSPKDPFQTIGRVILPSADLMAPSRVKITDVTPGNEQKYFGESVWITAKIKGLKGNEYPKILLTSDDGRKKEFAVPLIYDENSNSYRAEIGRDGGLKESFAYRIEAGDAKTVTHRIDVRTCPTIFLESIEYTPPAYTEILPQTVDQPESISGVEGTVAKVFARTNLPAETAYLELLREVKIPADQPDQTQMQAVKSIRLSPVTENAASGENRISGENKGEDSGVDDNLLTGELTLELNAKRDGQRFTHYRVVFTTAEGDKSQNPNVAPIEITPDLSPEIVVESPRETSVKVPENQVEKIEVSAVDPDYGLTAITLIAEHKGNRLFRKLIFKSETVKGVSGKQVAQFRFRPDEYGLKSGSEVIWYVRAEDNRALGPQQTLVPNRKRTDNYKFLIVDPLKRENTDPKENNDSENKNTENQQPEKNDSQKDDPQKNSQQNSTDKKDPNQSQSENQDPNQKSQPQNSENKSSDQGSDQGSEQPKKGGSSEDKQQQDSNQKQDSNQQQGSGEKKQDPGKQGGSDQKEQGSEQKGKGSNQKQSGSQSDPANNSEQANQNQQSGSKESPSKTQNSSGNQSENQQPANSDPQTGKNSQNSKAGESGSEDPSRSNEKPSNSKEAFERLKEYFDKKKEQGQESQSDQNNSNSDPSQENSTNPEKGSSNPSPEKKDQNSSSDPMKQGENESSPKQADPKSDDPSKSGSAGDKRDPSQTKKKSGTDSTSKKSDPGKKESGQEEPGQKGASKSDSGDKELKKKEPGKQNSTENSSQDQAQKDDPKQGDPKQGDSNKNGSDPSKSAQNDGSQNQKNDAAKKNPSSQDDNSQKGDSQKDNSQKKSPQNSSDRQQDSTAKDQNPNDASKSGDSKQGKNSSNDPKQGDPKQGDPKQGDPKQGDPKQGDPKQGDPKQGDPKQGDSKQGDSKQGDSKQDSQKSSEQNKGNQGKQSQSPADDSKQKSGGNTGDANQSSSKAGQQNNDSSQQDQSGQPAGDQSEAEKANLEYTRKTTEMVLEKLKDQQNRPDEDLLKDLNWTEEELQEFTKRWETMRKKAKSGGKQDEKRFQEALRSLGLTDPRNTVTNQKLTDDKKTGYKQRGGTRRVPTDFAKQFRAIQKSQRKLQNEE